MTRRLLFDQNLSPRLVELVGDRFPDSVDVQQVELATASDLETPEFAVIQGRIIVTQDKDFADLVTSRGAGPQILWDAADSILHLLDLPGVQIVQLTQESAR